MTVQVLQCWSRSCSQRLSSTCLKSIAAASFAVGALVAQFVLVLPLHQLRSWGKPYADFCLRQPPRVVAYYGAKPPQILSRDDGVIAFATGFATASGTHLALDAVAMEALRSGEFQSLLEARKVDRVTSLYYAGAYGFRPGEVSNRVTAFARQVLQEEPSRSYRADYVDGNFGIMSTAAHPTTTPASTPVP